MKRTKTLRDFLPHGLFGRTVLIILLPILLLQGLATYIFFDRHWTRMTERLAFSVAGEIAAISEEIELSPNGALTNDILKGLAAKHFNMLLTYEPDIRNDALQSSAGNGPGLEDTLARAMTNQVRRPFGVDINLDRKRIDVEVQLTTGLLRASMPQSRMYDSSGYIFVLWLNGLALLFFCVSIIFMRNQIRPIRRLAVASERFGKGADVQPYKPSGASEIRRATEAFFSMKERITRAVQQRTAMLAGISHDLRTPLTRMKLQIAMMPDSADTEALRQDIADMETMVEGYLAFMRGEGDEPSQFHDLVQLVKRIVANARRQNFDVRLASPETLEVEMRTGALERALTNIVENARKYANRAEITLGLDKHNNWVEIFIDDDGPGIPPDKYEDAFKPFQRLEESRSRKTGGTGLGLAIAQDVILGHGGRIFLSQSPLGGLRVTLHLPL